METPPFKGATLQQEVAVSSIFSDYSSNRERYDWVVPQLKVIIECHGIQHYKFQTFGEDAEVALMRWKAAKSRDARKKEVAIENGWTYMEIPYTDEKDIDSAYLLEKFNSSFNEEEVRDTASKQPQWHVEAKAIQSEKAKLARRANYQYLKKLKEKYKYDNSD